MVRDEELSSVLSQNGNSRMLIIRFKKKKNLNFLCKFNRNKNYFEK